MDSVLVSFVFSLWIINEFEKDKETNDFSGRKHGQKCQKVGGEPVGNFNSVAEDRDLNSGQQRTNPASGQSWT